MADELEEVRQRFVADLSDYAEPIKRGAADTEAFAEAVKQARDAVYEMYPGIDDATASLFAEAAAADDAASAMQYLNHEMDRARDGGSGLFSTLKTLRDELADFGEGGSITIAKTGWDRYTTSVEDSGTAMKRARQEARDLEAEIHKTGVEADEAFMKGRQAADDFRKGLDDLKFAIEDMITGGLMSGGGGRGGIFSRIFGQGGGFASMFTSLPEIPNMLLIIAGLLPVVAAVVTELTAVAGGFGAAALGVGAFIAIALPDIKQITGAYTTLHNAQLKVNQARLQYNADPTKANATALKTALNELAIQEQKVPGPIRDILRSFTELKDAWKRDSKELQPTVFHLISDALKIATPLLNGLLTWAQTAAGPLTRVADAIREAFDPLKELPSNKSLFKQDAAAPQLSGWQQFVKTLQPYITQSIPAIASGIADIGNSIKDLLTVLSPKDTANGIQIFFSIIAGGIRSVAQIVRWSVRWWHNFSEAIDWVKHAFDNLSHAYSNFSHANDNVHHAFDNIGHAITNVVHWFDDMNRFIQRVASDIGHWIGQMASDVISWFLRLMSWVVTHWNTGWSQVVAFARRVPGDILHALGSLGSLLVSAGESLIEGLIRGIESQIPGLQGAVNFVHRLLADIGIGSGGGSVPNITSGVGKAATGALGPTGTHPGSRSSSGVTVRVSAASLPQYEQALQRHVQAAVLGFAQANPGALLAMPGRRS